MFRAEKGPKFYSCIMTDKQNFSNTTLHKRSALCAKIFQVILAVLHIVQTSMNVYILQLLHSTNTIADDICSLNIMQDSIDWNIRWNLFFVQNWSTWFRFSASNVRSPLF